MLNGRVKLHLDLSDQPLFFWGDEAKFQRIMINLTSNALNAMPTGGILTIETRLVELDATSAKARRLQPGLHCPVDHP
jgi:signal transduction histidine kinase